MVLIFVLVRVELTRALTFVVSLCLHDGNPRSDMASPACTSPDLAHLVAPVPSSFSFNLYRPPGIRYIHLFSFSN